MGSTKIEWATHVWNPVTGCSPVSEGCTNCYAQANSRRFWKGRPFTDVKLHEDRLVEPLKWRKPRRVFVCSMGDLFHENLKAFEIENVLGIADRAVEEAKGKAPYQPSVFMFLTKRAQRMREVVTNWIELCRKHGVEPDLRFLWFGVTAENQARANERIPHLLRTPAVVRFVSVEPMLGRINLERASCDCPWPEDAMKTRHHLDCPCSRFPLPRNMPLDWVVCGAETGPRKREMEWGWATNLYLQAHHAGVPFFFKKNSQGDDRFNAGLPSIRQFPRLA